MTTLTPEEAERQYNARAAIPDHPQIFERWRAMSAQARETHVCQCDYRYGPSAAEALDFFPAEGDGRLLAFIHGGYWRSLDKADFSFLAPAFVDRGVHVVLPNYGLAPAVSMEDIVRQMLKACAWLWRNAGELGVDRRRIHVAGHSAGGHLAAMMLAADFPAYAPDLPADLVRGALAVSGVFDLEPLVPAPFLREDLRLDEERARRLSPTSYEPKRRAPLYTAVGALESGEFHRQNELITEAWPHCHRVHVEVPGRNHLNVMDEFARPASPLFGLALRMLELA